MRVHVSDLKPGNHLNSDAYSSRGLHVLPKGSLLQIDDIAKLMQHGVDYVDIQTLVEEPAPLSRPSIIQTVTTSFDTMIDGFENLYMEALLKGSFNQSVVNDILQPSLQSLDKQKDVVSCCFCSIAKIIIPTITLCR